MATKTKPLAGKGNTKAKPRRPRGTGSEWADDLYDRYSPQELADEVSWLDDDDESHHAAACDPANLLGMGDRPFVALGR